MRTPPLRLLLYVATVLFLILDTANCFNSFVPLRIYFSLASPSPRSSLLPLLPSSPYRCPSLSYVSRRRSSTLPPFDSTSGLRAVSVPPSPSADPDDVSLPTSSDATLPSLRSPLLPDAATPPSGLPKDFSPRNTAKQLRKLNEEIDAVAAKIDAEKAEWKKANTKYKPVYQKSIDVLNEALKGLRATRDKLIDASFAAPVPAPGESTPLYEFCAFCCRRPPPQCVCVTNPYPPPTLACHYALLRFSSPPPSRRHRILLCHSSCLHRSQRPACCGR